MNRSLRRRHRTMIATLAIAGTLSLVVGLTARQPPVDNPGLAALEVAPGALDQTVYRRPDVFADSVLEIELRESSREDGGLSIGVRTVGPLRIAAGALYWHPLPLESSLLPEEAYLLGPLPDGRWVGYALPQHAQLHDGYLILYSAVHDSVHASAVLPTASAIRRDVR